jgi:hypothetical protein
VEQLPTLLFAFEAIRRKRDEREVAERDPLCSKLNVGFLVGRGEIVAAKKEEAGSSVAGQWEFSLCCLLPQTRTWRLFVVSEIGFPQVAADVVVRFQRIRVVA